MQGILSCLLSFCGTHLLYKDQVRVQPKHIDYDMECGYGAVSSLKPRIQITFNDYRIVDVCATNFQV